MIVADTNVVSEFMRDRPEPKVLRWAESIATGDLGICVVTVEEIERGLGRMPPGRRRSELQLRWERLLAAYGSSVAVYDVDAARATARVTVDAEMAGRPIALADAQIAGICISAGHALATRNVRDFTVAAGLAVVDPFA